MDLLILLIAALAIGISIVVTAILMITKKLKIGGPFIVYPILTLLPLILLLFSIAILVSLVELAISHFLQILLIWLIILEIYAFVIFILIKFNVFPGSLLEKKQNTPKKYLNIDYGRRLLHYAIYAGIIYYIPTITTIVYYANKYNKNILFCIMHPLLIAEYILGYAIVTIILPIMTLPITAIALAAVIVLITIILLLTLVFIMSMNGTIRILYASEQIRKNGVLYVVLMFIPLVNIVCMIYLCHLVKKELKTISIDG